MSGGWTLEADLDLCQGHQMCRLDAPDLFEFDDAADKVIVVDAHPPDDRRAAAQEAVVHCPAMALTVREDHE
jgi:ferredoxin